MNSPISLERGSAANTPPGPPTRPGTVSPQKTDFGDPYDDGDGYYQDDSEPEDTGPTFAVQDQLAGHTAETLTIRELHSLIHEGNIDLNPPYQRDVVWPAKKQALLIDSLFRNFYIPPVVFAVTQDEEGVPIRVCVDGKQRLTSIQRFLDGQLPYVQSKKQHWYYTCPESTRKQKLQLPDEDKRRFDTKTITCVEYVDLTPALEREIFQRVQLGMALTTAEKLAAVDSPFAQWISTLESQHISIEGGLSQKLTWDTKRGREFQNVAHFVYCCDGYPASENMPTSQKMEKWLSRADPPGQQFKKQIEEALSEFGLIAADKDLKAIAFPGQQRIAPIEFVFIGVLIYVLRQATLIQRAQAINILRTDIREQFLDIRFNTAVGAALWRIIRHLQHSPTTSTPSAPVASTPKRKRKMISQDSDDEYHPSPVHGLGRNPKTRSKTRLN